MKLLRTLSIVATTWVPFITFAGALDRLGGTWDTMPIDKPICENDDYQHEIVVSADKERVTFKHVKPIDGPSGKTQHYTYKVVYEQEDRVTLYMEGETSKLPNGDRLIWELILERPDYYRWRVYGLSADWRNTVVGKRCKD